MTDGQSAVVEANLTCATLKHPHVDRAAVKIETGNRLVCRSIIRKRRSLIDGNDELLRNVIIDVYIGSCQIKIRLVKDKGRAVLQTILRRSKGKIVTVRLISRKIHRNDALSRHFIREENIIAVIDFDCRTRSIEDDASGAEPFRAVENEGSVGSVSLTQLHNTGITRRSDVFIDGKRSLINEKIAVARYDTEDLTGCSAVLERQVSVKRQLTASINFNSINSIRARVDIRTGNNKVVRLSKSFFMRNESSAGCNGGIAAKFIAGICKRYVSARSNRQIA